MTRLAASCSKPMTDIWMWANWPVQCRAFWLWRGGYKHYYARFVGKQADWAHIDVMANLAVSPGDQRLWAFTYLPLFRSGQHNLAPKDIALNI